MKIELQSAEIEIIRDSLLSARARQYQILQRLDNENLRGYPYNRYNSEQKEKSENRINEIQNILNRLK